MTNKEKPSIEKQIEIYDMLNARCGVTDEGIEGVLTWEQIKEVYNSLSEESEDENKEVRKLEQKSAWSEEDELMLLSTIQSIEMTNGASQLKIDWLKSLKQRIKG